MFPLEIVQKAIRVDKQVNGIVCQTNLYMKQTFKVFEKH